MVEQLASLLLPIDALLAHADFNPHINASPEIASLFRNMWFLCVLFHFTTDDHKEDRALEWQKPALARIAAKTPPLVVEGAHDFIANELDYNTVIRHEYAHSVRTCLPHSQSFLDGLYGADCAKTCQCSREARIITYRRRTPAIPGPSAILAGDAGCGEYALGGRPAIFPRVIFHKREHQQA